MFYSAEVLSVKSKSSLSVVWLAGTVSTTGRRLGTSKANYNAVDIEQTCEYLQNPPEPLSLRLQAMLLVGVCRIYGSQYGQYAGQVEGFWRELIVAAPTIKEQPEKPRHAQKPSMKRISLEQLDEAIKVDDFLQELTPERFLKLSSLTHANNQKISSILNEGALSSQPQEGFNESLLNEFEDVLKDYATPKGDAKEADSNKTSNVSSLLRPKLSSQSEQEDRLPKVKRRRQLESLIIFDEETTIEISSTLNLPERPRKRPKKVNLMELLQVPLLNIVLMPPSSALSSPSSKPLASAVSFVEYEVPLRDSDMQHAPDDEINLDSLTFEPAEQHSPWSVISDGDNAEKFLRYLTVEAYPREQLLFQDLQLHRSSAAKAFHLLLGLASAGSVHPSQPHPFGPIQVDLQN